MASGCSQAAYCGGTCHVAIAADVDGFSQRGLAMALSVAAPVASASGARLHIRPCH